MLSTNNDNEPPHAPNPLLNAYENFQTQTPLVTRLLVSLQVIGFISSWFWDAKYALGCSLQFTIFRFEFYRVLLSPLVNDSLFGLAFVFLAFIDHGRRLEVNMGSTRFAWYCLWLGTLANTSFLLTSLILYFLTNESTWLITSSSGIWTILMGLLAMDCKLASTRRFSRRMFCIEIPVLYYPLAVYVLLAFAAQSVQPWYALSLTWGYSLDTLLMALPGLKVRRTQALAVLADQWMQ